ncbi:MAG TPA: fibronectin type III domain-containing protein [Kofleriaceae bacterium]|nr:fibronectin type III domain-containing protein [Kofleriaceae bacterium]
MRSGAERGRGGRGRSCRRPSGARTFAWTARAAAALAIAAAAAPAHASGQCHAITATFVPADQLQIVAWIETAAGVYVDTIYITQKVGHYGLGNRPGRFDLNSGPIVHDLWPYGRRITTFPVWAHRHGMTFPEVVFQDGDDDDISHGVEISSPEKVPPFCRPMDADSDSLAWDAGTCATTSTVYTDKGTFAADGSTSLYPPRADLVRQPPYDSPSVDMYAALDPFDAVAQATPVGGAPAQITWSIPSGLADGDYVLFVEVGQAFDYNATYNPTSYPSPMNLPYGGYGKPYRGQPSIVYATSFTIGATDSNGSAASYAGYGDPAGTSGVLNPPDSTITTDTPNSGASRLAVIPGTSDRLEVAAQNISDTIPPGIPSQLVPIAVTSSTISLQFDAPGDDGYTGGSVAGYDIRVRTVDALTPANFDDPQSSKVLAALAITSPGTQETVELDGLLPETDYWVGIRAYDMCHNDGDIAIVHVTTSPRAAGYVDACFVATAAYGSRMAADVEPLRRFRDLALETSALGELAVETYYTFGPAAARVVGESELLRASARGVLAPVVARVRRAGF